MSVVNKLTELGYDGADIHWLHSFYDIKIIIKDPTSKNDNELIKQRERYGKMEKLVNGGNKFYIDQAVEFGRFGLTYDSVKFKTE